MGFDRRNLKGRWHLGTLTATAGTAFIGTIPPKSNGKTVLSMLSFLSGSTQHTLSILRAQGATTTTAAQAASDTTLTLASVNPAKDLNGDSLGETLASGDWLVVEHSDGSYGAYVVSSVSGLVVTLSTTSTTPATSLAKAVDSGAAVYAMHELARTAGIPSIQITPKISIQDKFPAAGTDPEVGCASSLNKNEPLLIHCNNITAQSWIEYAEACYVDL